MEGVKKKDEVGGLDKTAIHILEELEPRRQAKARPTMSENFHSQKEKVESLLRQYIQVTGQNQFDFQNKYLNLFDYFKERFKLANLYVGDEQIKQFLRQNQDIIEREIAKNKTDLSKPLENDKLYLKDLDAKHFIQDQELDKNSNTIKKILRVNQEIKKELMEEDHEERLKMIDDFKIQQKQNYWEKMLDDDQPKTRIQSQGIQRSAKTRVLPTRPQTNQMTKSDAFLQKTRIAHTTSLKKKMIFYQAHPNFPLIKQVYHDQDDNILHQEQQIKNFIIGPDMKRIKKVQLFKSQEEQYQQKFLTSFQENMFFSKVQVDPKKVKTPNQYKHDAHTTMQSEVRSD